MKEEPTCIVNPEGNKFWCIGEKIHREDGPAVEYANGDKSWWQNNHLHREDGPAVEYAAGDRSWYLNDHYYHEKDYWRELYKRKKITKTELFLKLL